MQLYLVNFIKTFFNEHKENKSYIFLSSFYYQYREHFKFDKQNSLFF